MNARSTASARPPHPPPPAVTQQRKAEQTLRNEQDREYEETLLADQIRDIERREVEAKERRGREEEEEAELLETAKQASVLDDARSRMARAGDEPPLDYADGLARLRFNLPNGKKVDRRFRASDTIETVRAFLVVHFHEQGIKTKNPKYPRLGLITNFPKREFGEKDGRLSLEEAGLAPQAVVMVQDLDA